MDKLIVKPLTVVRQNNKVTRRCLIKRITNNIEESEDELWFSYEDQARPPEDDDCDSYVIAALMDAMAENRSLVVQGTVSHELLSNLVEFQLAWNKWLPKTYSVINIYVSRVRKNSGRLDGAICAFSGGVDATHTAWRHSNKALSYRSQDIKKGVIVHGFDIPLSNYESFQKVRSRSFATLQNLKIGIVSISTNFRKISRVSWEHAFACGLIATLNNLKNIAGNCLVGSSEPYDSLILPWGSSPVTDHLLSSDDFKVLHDGADRSRLEKVLDISDWKLGTENLRVCWQGEIKDENCGICEKCLRTQLNFLVNECAIPSCFPTVNLSAHIRKLTLQNDAVKNEWKQIYEFTKTSNLDSKLVKEVKRVVHKKPLNLLLFPEHSYRRKWTKKLLNYFRQ